MLKTSCYCPFIWCLFTNSVLHNIAASHPFPQYYIAASLTRRWIVVVGQIAPKVNIAAIPRLSKYGVCLLRTRTPKLSGATLIGKIAWLNILYSAFHFQKLLFQVFLPISHLIGRSRSAIYRSHLIPCKSSSLRFWEIVRHGQKKLKRLQKIAGRSTMTRPWQ